MPLVGPVPPDTAPADLLARARQGELSAFDALMRRHEPRVYSLALRFTGRRADAEELAQDTFLLLHRSLGQLADEAHLTRWLLRTITHRCLNRLRNDRRRPSLVSMEAMPAEAEPVAEGGQADPLAASKLRSLILELAPEARAVLLLRFQEDLEPSGISAVLGMSVNTVKSHLRRSLETLRQRIGGGHNGS